MASVFGHRYIRNATWFQLIIPRAALDNHDFDLGTFARIVFDVLTQEPDIEWPAGPDVATCEIAAPDNLQPYAWAWWNIDLRTITAADDWTRFGAYLRFKLEMQIADLYAA